MKELGVFEQLLQLAYLPTYYKLIKGAMELDVFSYLTEPVSAEEIAEKTGWNEANTKVLLDGLYSVRFIDKQGDKYVNTEEGNRYLIAASPDYAMGFMQVYMQGSAAPLDVAKLVREGSAPEAMQQMNESMDFTAYGESFRRAQRGCRQQEVLRIVRDLPENGQIKKILDIGCNTGLLGLAVIGDAFGRTGVLFDMPPLCPLIDESIEQAGLVGRAVSMGGDFLKDDLGDGYDLILAVSVMLFAKGDMTGFLKKMRDALAPGGVIVCMTEGVSRDFSEPWDMIMGYLPYWFQGMDMAVYAGEIEDAAKAAGFSEVSSHSERLCSGTQNIVILRK